MMEDCLKKIVDGQDLTENQAYECMNEMISGKTSQLIMAGFLSALSCKGETSSEITGFVKAMQEACITISPSLDTPLVDTCGTGGDILKTFNVSTTASIIAASCGVIIAKHGNRGVTGKFGGADILEALGVNIEGEADKVEECLEKTGLGFMFAPNFHPAIKNVMPVRKELGIRTVFNILGPLTSPASVTIQLLGVFDPKYVKIMAEVLKNIGHKRAMVVHGFDRQGQPAVDEISTIGKSIIAILDDGKITIQEICPQDLGIKTAQKKHIMAPKTLKENKKLVLNVLKGKKSTEIDESRLNLCLANAGAVLFISGKATNLKEGVEIAQNAIESGLALKKLEDFVEISGSSEIQI
jgi:anthranilate phosphoribosyltransferase